MEGKHIQIISGKKTYHLSGVIYHARTISTQDLQVILGPVLGDSPEIHQDSPGLFERIEPCGGRPQFL